MAVPVYSFRLRRIWQSCRTWRGKECRGKWNLGGRPILPTPSKRPPQHSMNGFWRWEKMLKRKRKCPGVPHIVTHCAGVPHIVRWSWARADLDSRDSRLEAAGSEEENHDHAHRKPFRGEILIYQLVSITTIEWVWMKTWKGTLKSMCNGQESPSRLKDSPLLHPAG